MVNCMKCAHYYVTWDPNRPRGCRYFGFKSKELPSVIVRRSSGEDCKVYRPKGKE
jgi:hypothetical protein